MEKECLSVVMPVHNEKETLPRIAEKVLKLDFLKELIIVDDGSTDGTAEFLKAKDFGPRVKVLFHGKNMGKGAALRTAFKEATADIVAVQDADLEYDPTEINDLIEPIRKGVADVVYGSRLTGGKAQRVYMFWHLVGNRFLTFLTNMLYNSTLTDMETCYKAFRREVIQGITLRSDDFSVEPEMTAKVLKRNLRVYEIPISYYGRTYDEGKKIRWFHGLTAIWTLIRYRFTD